MELPQLASFADEAIDDVDARIRNFVDQHAEANGFYVFVGEVVDRYPVSVTQRFYGDPATWPHPYNVIALLRKVIPAARIGEDSFYVAGRPELHLPGETVRQGAIVTVVRIEGERRVFVIGCSGVASEDDQEVAEAIGRGLARRVEAAA